MHSLDYYIRELLFEYDCVTIPGLGGFITQAKPARLMRERRRIYPPSRIVSFNALLSNEDGLLANAIARHEGISYREAVQRIEFFTLECKKDLESGKSVTFEGVGIMSVNPEGNLTFQPFPDVNFSASNYGLDSIFVHPPALPETPSRARSVRHIDRKPITERQKLPASVKWTLAIALPVIAFLLWGIIFPGSFQRVYTNYTSIGTDLLKIDRKDAPVEVFKADPTPTNESRVENLEIPVIVPDIEPTPLAESSTATLKTESPGPRYYIIGGCFENESNALKFLNELKSKGYNAELAGTTKLGHLRVCYDSFPTKQQALEYLGKIKKQEDPAAWLLKY